MVETFQDKLEKYARVLVEKGLNVQPGETVAVNIPVFNYELARLITRFSYERGAAEVIVDYSDSHRQRENFLHAKEERIVNVPEHAIKKMEYLLEKKASRLSIVGGDPDALNGVDHDRLSRAMKANGIAMKPMRMATQANEVAWTVAAAATPEWAAKVFPDLDEQAGVEKLWEQIFKTVRIDTPDPIEAWNLHEAQLVAKATWLNDEQFDALRYEAPGTDFIVGLPQNHVWEAAGSTSRQGTRFIANMPTEEVFTAPDFRRAEGYVASTKPLSYAGNVIEDMVFEFKDGKVVNVTAKKGEETIKRLVEENKGAECLGEVALVPDPSPISQSGIIFFNTLFDENASNHLALGSAYASSVEGGVDMTQEELEAAGLNRSDTHVDFMIGSAEMNVYGIRANGEEVQILRNGDWA